MAVREGAVEKRVQWEARAGKAQGGTHFVAEVNKEHGL